MVQDAIKLWDKNLPAGGTKIYDGDDKIRDNNAALQEMAGAWMQGLEVTCAGAKVITIDYTRLGMELNTGVPSAVFVDHSPSTITINWDNGEAMNGRETGLALTAGWKYIWIYRDDTNGLTKGLLSAAKVIGSVVEPDTDFRFGRLVGAAYWDGASAFRAFLQNDKIVDYKGNYQILANGRSDGTWTQISLAAYVPSIATHAWYKGGAFTDSGTPLFCSLTTAADTSGNYEQGYVVGDLAAASTGFGSNFMQKLTSQNISYKTTDTAGVLRADIFINGYEIAI